MRDRMLIPADLGGPGYAAIAGRPMKSRRDILLASLLATGGFSWSGTSASERPSQAMHARHLQVDNTVGDLLRHPAFAGFARRLMPWDDRAPDENMALSAFGTLLPYHSHFSTPLAVESLNRLIDDAGAGVTIFYDIHDDAARRREPDKANTGLFYYRGKPGAPFAIIAPGGGFAYVGTVHEGLPYAMAISRSGYNAFVLKYRAGRGGAVATEDLAAALSYVVRNAKALGVSSSGYSLWGSSAGARMAAAIGSSGAVRFGGDDLPKPAAVVLAYTAHSDVGTREPPTFVVVGEQDGISPPSAMERRLEVLRSLGVDTRYRKISGVGHGFGLGAGTPAEGWISEAIAFWERHQPR